MSHRPRGRGAHSRSVDAKNAHAALPSMPACRSLDRTQHLPDNRSDGSNLCAHPLTDASSTHVDAMLSVSSSGTETIESFLPQPACWAFDASLTALQSNTYHSLALTRALLKMPFCSGYEPEVAPLRRFATPPIQCPPSFPQPQGAAGSALGQAAAESDRRWP